MRATVDRAVFAESVAVAHFQGGRFADVFQVLGFTPDHGEGEKLVSFPENRRAFEHHVGVEYALVAQGHVRADDTIRADPDVFSELSLRGNDGGGVDHLRILRHLGAR